MNKKSNKWYLLLIIILITAAVLSYVFPVKHNKVETNLAMKETSRNRLHKEIVNELTMVFSGYIKVDGEETKSSEINAIRSVISFGNDDFDFDFNRVFINSYFQGRNDVRVMEPWNYNSEWESYNMGLQTTNSENSILISFFDKKNELWISTVMDSPGSILKSV